MCHMWHKSLETVKLYERTLETFFWLIKWRLGREKRRGKLCLGIIFISSAITNTHSRFWKLYIFLARSLKQKARWWCRKKQRTRKRGEIENVEEQMSVFHFHKTWDSHLHDDVCSHINVKVFLRQQNSLHSIL